MPSRRGEAAEQRLAARLLVEMKRLRIELRGEFLDRFRGEGERSKLAARTDFDVFKETHRTSYSAAASAQRRTMIGVTISPSATPAAFRTTPLKVTMPVSGRLRETRAAATSISRVRSSPGRNGASQRISSTPGEPIDAVRPMKPSNIIRIRSEHKCQPEPERPFSIDLAAAASSRCIGCGSYSAANARISSRVTWRGPNVPKWPGLKSSKVSVVMLAICCGKPDCGRYLRQSQ